MRNLTNCVFDVGTGHARTFNKLATNFIVELGIVEIKYIDFPDFLRDKYQYFTQADLRPLRDAGFVEALYDLEHGLALYVEYLRDRKD